MINQNIKGEERNDGYNFNCHHRNLVYFRWFCFEVIMGLVYGANTKAAHDFPSASNWYRNHC